LRRLRIIIPRQPFPNVFSGVAMPPLGPLYVASSVRAAGGWEVEVIDENNWLRSGDHRRLQEIRPADVVGFYGGMTSSVPRLYELAQQYRDMGVFTIAGGGHVDYLHPEALANGVGVVVNGEAEETTPELLTAWERGEDLRGIDGISFLDNDGEIVVTPRRVPITDFSQVARPDFSMIIEQRRPYRWIPVSHLRGCPYHCEFCSVHRLLGDTHGHTVDQTAEYLESLVGQKHREFFFVDDNFVGNRDETIELLQRIQAIAVRNRTELKLNVQLRAEVARDEELMREMRKAGVQLVALGLESPLEEDLKVMKKGQSAEQMKQDLAAFRRFGFYIHGMFIFGYPSPPGAPPPSVPLWMQARVFLDFIRKTGIDTIQVLKAVPIPGSKLFERLRDRGRILPLNEVGWEYYDGNFLTYVPEDSNFAEVHEGAVWIMRKFYSAANLLRLSYLLSCAPVLVAISTVRSWIEQARRQRLVELAVATRPHPLRRLGLTIVEGMREGCADFARSVRNASMRSAGYFIVRRWLYQMRSGKFAQVLRQMRRSKTGQTQF
jgi:radical SAM superfamily enzyme YgiQ (UPF0313 family)